MNENDTIKNKEKSDEENSLNDNSDNQLNLKNEKEELEKSLEKWKKQCADLINQSAISKKQATEAIKYGNRKILEQLLFFLDNYKQALKSSQSEKDSKVEKFLEGFKMIFSEFQNFLTKQGVEMIKINVGEDKFDGKLHQVLEVEKNENYPEETILEILREGYFFHDSVLRPAMVKVSKK